MMIPILPLEVEGGDIEYWSAGKWPSWCQSFCSPPRWRDTSPPCSDKWTHYDPCEHLQELCVVTLVSPAHRSDEALVWFICDPRVSQRGPGHWTTCWWPPISPKQMMRVNSESSLSHFLLKLSSPCHHLGQVDCPAGCHRTSLIDKSEAESQSKV